MLLHDPAAYPQVRKQDGDYYYRNHRWLHVARETQGYRLSTAAGDWHIEPLTP